ncbi:MAG: hypothetical protein ACYC1K_02890 [Minisyncoccota bacterium]
MKKYLSHILVPAFLLTILVGIGGSVFPHAIQAQTIPPTNQTPSITVAQETGPAAAIAQWFFKIGASMALGLTSLVTMLGGTSLNYAMCYTVVNMAHNYSGISSINTAWGTIRDLANMGFIFILLYASIKLIVGMGTGSDTRKLIVNMIIAALLINFSLFFTKVIVDSSNILAITFYKAIAPAATDCGTTLNAGLSNSVMSVTGLESLWNANNAGLKDLQIITIGIMGSIVNLIAGFIFFATALLFFIRYVVLILVLILSPIAVVAIIIPGLSGPAKQWQSALFGQAFFAPVYLMLTWIALLILNDQTFKDLRGTGTLSEAMAGSGTTVVSYNASAIGLVVNFFIVIIFLIASLIIAKQMSDKAGGAVSKFTGKALGMAGGATLGMAGRFGRGTVGRLGAGIASSERLKDLVDKGGVGGMAARLAMAAGEKTAKKSFDLRGSALGESLGGGKAKSGGFAKDEAERQKAAIARAKSLKPNGAALERAAAAESGTKERLEEVRKNTYTQSAASAAAIQAAKDAVENAKTKDPYESELEWESRRAQAETKLREEEASETRARESAEANSEEFKQAKFRAEEAERAHADLKNKAQTRPANYAASRATDIFGTQGVGGAINTGLGTVANKIRESEIGKRRGALGYLTRKVAGGITIVGRSAGLRQEEREAQAASIRKGIREKTKEEKALDAIAEAAKERLEKEEKDKKDNAPEDSDKK